MTEIKEVKEQTPAAPKAQTSLHPPPVDKPKVEVIPATKVGEAMEIKGANIEDVTVQRLIRPGSMLEVRNKLGFEERNRGMHRAWVRNRGTNADQNVDMRRGMGYKPASVEHYDVTVPPNAGGVIQAGDMMLMEMPVSLKNQHQAETDKANAAREKSAKTKMKDEMSRIKGHPAGVKGEDLVIGE